MSLWLLSRCHCRVDILFKMQCALITRANCWKFGLDCREPIDSCELTRCSRLCSWVSFVQVGEGARSRCHLSIWNQHALAHIDSWGCMSLEFLSSQSPERVWWRQNICFCWRLSRQNEVFLLVCLRNTRLQTLLPVVLSECHVLLFWRSLAFKNI